MLRAQHVTVPRGQAAVIPLSLGDLGSPTPTLVFTLAGARNAQLKLWTGTVVDLGSPDGLTVTVPVDITNRQPCTLWWDVWNTDANLLLAIGSLEIQRVVRLP